MEHLDQLESKSIYIIREAYRQYKRIAVLWSIGKDSTSLMWIIRKAFFGNVPFPAVHIDTGHKFKEIYDFRDRWGKEWDFKVIVAKNESAMAEGMGPHRERFSCCNALKTDALKQTLDIHHFNALLLGIRRDEHGIRAKERVFSPRDRNFQWSYKNQPPELWSLYKSKKEGEEHIRIHPLLHWSEIDIWRYLEREKIPTVNLYFAQNGKRYRSIGCKTCCDPIPSKADTIEKIIKELKTSKISERSGRSQDKESTYIMQKLRHLGYM